MPTLSFFLLSPQVLTPIITTTSFTLNPASALALPLSTALMLTPLNPLDFDWKICRPSLAPCRLLIVVRTMPMATCLPRTCACACAVNMESMVKSSIRLFFQIFFSIFPKKKNGTPGGSKTMLSRDTDSRDSNVLGFTALSIQLQLPSMSSNTLWLYSYDPTSSNACR